MTIFYIICALICLGAILCNQYGCEGDKRLQGGWLVFAVALSVTPFLNIMYIVAMAVAGWNLVKGR